MIKKTLLIILLVLCLGCAGTLKTPKGWDIVRKNKTISPPYGRCNPKLKKIEIIPPLLIPSAISEPIILDHELGHAYGIKSCKKISCIMYENKNRLLEILSKPFQFLNRFRFCRKCKEYLLNKDAFKEK